MAELASKVSPSAVYEAEHLCKTFFLGKRSIEAVRDVSIAIDEGDFAVVVGHSGSGKSTLLSLLGGLDVPTLGTLRFLGDDMCSLSEDARAIMRRNQIGFVFQFFNLIDFLSAYENVALPLRLQRKSEALIEEKATDLLWQVGLGDRMTHKPLTLSGGEQQRVAIARALVTSPKVVLADEPTGNLDTKTGEEIIAIMQNLNKTQRQTFVVVTHDHKIAQVANKVFYMKDGGIERVESR